MSHRVDEERDLMIDNLVEIFNNKSDDLEAKVDDLYTKLVSGVKKYVSSGTPLEKETLGKIMEVEKNIRKEIDRKYAQINKTIQGENNSIRGLVTRERQTACNAANKVERELAKVESRFITDTRKLEKRILGGILENSFFWSKIRFFGQKFVFCSKNRFFAQKIRFALYFSPPSPT